MTKKPLNIFEKERCIRQIVDLLRVCKPEVIDEFADCVAELSRTPRPETKIFNFRKELGLSQLNQLLRDADADFVDVLLQKLQSHRQSCQPPSRF